MTQHHPDSNTLTEFSAGNLTEAYALCIRLHLDQCPQCRSMVDSLDSIGAILMEKEAQEPVSSSTFDDILARIDEAPETEAEEIPSFREKPGRNALERLLESNINDLPWKKQLADVSVCDISHLFPDQPEQVVLQKLVAGGKAPSHTHRGTETTIVLQGAFMDKKGVFDQWDFVTLDGSVDHKPVALEGEDCITLSVLSAPLKLTGTFTRLLNPFIR